jgi:hypothetical protein
MNGVIVVVGEGLHIIEDDPVNYKYGKAKYKFS